MSRVEVAGWLVAALFTLASPDEGAVLIALLSLAPLLPPWPRTRRSLGPALVTAVILASGTLGLSILQLTRRFATPLAEHVALLGALVGMTFAALRFGAVDDPVEARDEALLRYLRAGLAAFSAVIVLVLVRRGGPGFETSKAMMPISAAAQGIGGTALFGLGLEWRSTLRALVRSPWTLALLGLDAALLAGVHLLHGP